MAKETLSKAAVNAVLQGTNAPVASVVDFDTGAGATTHALPVYDKAGNLLGYVPLFANTNFN